MSQTKQAPALLCDDAISVKIAGERRHFICIGIYSDKIKGYTYDLFDDEGYITSIDDNTFTSYLNLGAIIIKPDC